MYRKEIVFDRETRDYAMYLDGELTGFARTYHEAEVTLDQLVYELITSDLTYTATELDGAAIPDEDDPPLPNEIPGTNPPRCPICGADKPHDAWNVCPGKPIARFAAARARVAARRAMDDAPNPGRAIGRMWHKQPRDFIAVLRQLDVTAWITLAEAYAEWRGGDVTSVLDCWMLAAQGADVPTNARS